MQRERHWMVCEVRGETPCLFEEAAAMRLSSDPLRCVRHGALLFGYSDLDGLTRAQARKRLNEESMT